MLYDENCKMVDMIYAKICLKSGHMKVKTEGLRAKKWISYQQVWCDSVNACA